jgi:RNA polymerase sigma-70 factor (ECF subfamily)
VAESPATPPIQRDHAQGVTDTVTMLGALNQLSPEHREVLVEMYYRGRTVTETAAALGVPAGTVKSRSFYALRALRGVLGGGSRGDSAREAVT